MRVLFATITVYHIAKSEYCLSKSFNV